MRNVIERSIRLIACVSTLFLASFAGAQVPQPALSVPIPAATLPKACGIAGGQVVYCASNVTDSGAQLLYKNQPIGGGSPSLNQVILSTNCNGQANCFTVKADVQVVNDATWSNAGTTITTTSTDPAFACPNGNYPCASGGDVGKIEYGTSNCGTTNGFVNCMTEVPQGTIASVTSAHVAVVSGAATAASGPTVAWFAWGTQDDSPAMQSAMAAVLAAGGGGEIEVPCGNMFVQSAPFMVTVPHLAPINIRGCASTYLLPTPNFVQASCTAAGNSTSKTGCIFSDWETDRTLLGIEQQTPYVYDHLYDLNIFGLGQDGTATSTRHTAIAGNNIYLQNVSLIGWLWNQTETDTSACGFDVSSGFLLNSYSWSATLCGVAIEADSITDNPTQIINGLYGITTNGPGMAILGTNSGDGTQVISSGAQFDSLSSSATVLGVVQTGNGSLWYSNQDLTTGLVLNGSSNAPTAYLNGTQPYLGTFALKVPAGTVHARDIVATSLNAGTVGGILYDEGGNQWGTSVTSPSFVFGSQSALLGAFAAASEITASTGWGTTGAAGNGITMSSNTWNGKFITFTVTAAGTPTANPTITYTFPVTGAQPFLKAPICSLIQTGGTGAFLTPVINGTTSTTGTGAFTLTGTPVAGDTYIFQISCQY
jgi:hypothetical protein